MNVQFNILKECLKKTFKWMIIMFAVVFLYIISFSFIGEFDVSKIKLLFGCVSFDDIDLLGLLVLLYQFCFTIYFSYVYFYYELGDCNENILLRINIKKWVISKAFILLSAVFVYYLLFDFICLILFNIPFSFDLFNNILVHLTLAFAICLFYNQYNHKIFLIFLITFLCVIEFVIAILFPIINVFILILIFVYFCLFFNLKIKS